MVKIKTQFNVIILVLFIMCFFPSSANALSILAGSDYLTTVPGTFFDFGPGIGPVSMEGNPIGPGNTDTIVQRKADAILPGAGSTGIIPIELVQLSLQSVDPVFVIDSFFDVFIELDPDIPSLGQMTVKHDFPDNGTPDAEGTFDSFFDVFFKAEFVPTGGGGGGGGTFTIYNMIHLETPPEQPGLWSHEPFPNSVIVEGLPGDLTANIHHPPDPGFSDFFIIGSGLGPIPTFPYITEDHPVGGKHNAKNAEEIPPVPEPSTALLIAGGLLGLSFYGRRSRS